MAIDMMLLLLVVVLISVAVPAFGGDEGGGGGRGFGGSRRNRAMAYDDSDYDTNYHRGYRSYGNSFGWFDIVFWVGAAVVAGAVWVGGKLSSKRRVLELVLGIADAERIVPVLDLLVSTAEMSSPEGRGSALANLVGKLKSVRIASAIVHVSPASGRYEDEARLLYGQRIAQLQIAGVGGQRNRVDGGALVGIIVSLPHVVKVRPGGLAELGGALEALHKLDPSAMYIYFLPDEGKTLGLDEAERLTRALHA